MLENILQGWNKRVNMHETKKCIAREEKSGVISKLKNNNPKSSKER